jgi:hypothetical protein
MMTILINRIITVSGTLITPARIPVFRAVAPTPQSAAVAGGSIEGSTSGKIHNIIGHRSRLGVKGGAIDNPVIMKRIAICVIIMTGDTTPVYMIFVSMLPAGGSSLLQRRILVAYCAMTIINVAVTVPVFCRCGVARYITAIT